MITSTHSLARLLTCVRVCVRAGGRAVLGGDAPKRNGAPASVCRLITGAAGRYPNARIFIYLFVWGFFLASHSLPAHPEGKNKKEPAKNQGTRSSAVCHLKQKNCTERSVLAVRTSLISRRSRERKKIAFTKLTRPTRLKKLMGVGLNERRGCSTIDMQAAPPIFLTEN